MVLVAIFDQNAFVNPPFNNRASFNGDGLTLLNPFGGTLGALPIRNLVANAPDFRTPEIQQWSLGIQREIFKGAIIDISYVGTRGDHLVRQRNINLPRMCCKNYFAASEAVHRFSLCSKLEEALDELRLTHSITSC